MVTRKPITILERRKWIRRWRNGESFSTIGKTSVPPRHPTVISRHVTRDLREHPCPTCGCNGTHKRLDHYRDLNLEQNFGGQHGPKSI